MQYKLSHIETCVIQIEDDGTIRCIPNDLANTDWQTYQRWLSEGNEPLPADTE